jgi:hypothetical protein
MVIYNLDVVGIAVAPDEAQPPLVVDPDAVLPNPIAGQRLQAVRRRLPQVLTWSLMAACAVCAATPSPRSLGKPFGIRSFQTAAVRLSAKDRITL